MPAHASITPLLHAALCCLLLLWSAGCQHAVKPPAAGGGTLQEQPSQESWNDRVLFTDSGLVKAVLVATHVRMFEEVKLTLLDSGLTVDFYNTDKSHSSRLSADSGVVHDDTKNMEAFGHVVFRSDSGTVVTTEYLFWDNGTRKIRSDRFVSITSPKDRLQGYGFEADQGLKNYVVFRVSGTASVDR